MWSRTCAKQPVARGVHFTKARRIKQWSIMMIELDYTRCRTICADREECISRCSIVSVMNVSKSRSTHLDNLDCSARTRRILNLQVLFSTNYVRYGTSWSWNLIKATLLIRLIALVSLMKTLKARFFCWMLKCWKLLFPIYFGNP